ncbi:MAG: hypothetical protein ACTSU9_11990 [Promethearchaeota archaeon]
MHLDELSPLFTRLEASEYYGDEILAKSLSRKIFRRLNESAENLSRLSQNYIDAANYYISAAEIIQNYDFYEAITALEKAINIMKVAASRARDSNDFELAGNLFKKIADIHDEYFNNSIKSQKYYGKVIDCFERYLEISKEKGFNNLYVQYYNLAELNLHVSRWYDAESYAREAIADAVKGRRYYMVATSYRLLLESYLKRNKQDEVLTTFLEARKLFTDILQGLTVSSKMRNYMEIADVYHVFASFYDIIKDLDEFKNISLKEAYCYIEVAKEYEKEDDLIGCAIYYHGAGLVLKKIDNIRDAGDFFLLSAQKYLQVKIFDSSADNFILAADCMELQGEYEAAIELLVQAADLYKESSFLEMGISNLYKALDLHEFLSNNQRSIKKGILQKIIVFLEEVIESADERDAAYFFVEIAFLLYQEDQKQEGLSFLKQALDFFKISYSTRDEINAATCNDLLAIILLCIILGRDGEIEKYMSLMNEQVMKTPIGRDYEILAKKFIVYVRDGIIPRNLELRSKIIFNIPVIKWLVAILQTS